MTKSISLSVCMTDISSDNLAQTAIGYILPLTCVVSVAILLLPPHIYPSDISPASQQQQVEIVPHSTPSWHHVVHV